MASEYRGNDQGTREVLSRPIKDHHDWLHIRTLDVTKGVLGREVDCIRLVKAQLGGQAPILQTVFAPMTVAAKLTNERFVYDVRERRWELRQALGPITQTVSDFVQACLEAGADGIFYATQSATTAMFTEDEFREFGMENDLRVLESIKGKAKLVVLHIHGMDVMFDLLAGYPVDVINWHDRRTPPGLREALTRCTQGLAGGINERDTLPKATAERVDAEVADAIAQTSGRRLIVAPGCVMPVTTPEEIITATRCAVEKKGSK